METSVDHRSPFLYFYIYYWWIVFYAVILTYWFTVVSYVQLCDIATLQKEKGIDPGGGFPDVSGQL